MITKNKSAINPYLKDRHKNDVTKNNTRNNNAANPRTILNTDRGAEEKNARQHIH